MKKFFLSIPTISIYFYTATILTEYGFISYFNIPPNFITASLARNIVYFHSFFISVQYAASTIKWWIWLILSFIILFIIFLCYSSKFLKGTITIVGSSILLISLVIFPPKLGNFIAINSINFLTPKNCQTLDEGITYIIPFINNDQAILVPIDQNNKITGGFLTKKISELNCLIEQREIGKITK